MSELLLSQLSFCVMSELLLSELSLYVMSELLLSEVCPYALSELYVYPRLSPINCKSGVNAAFLLNFLEHKFLDPSDLMLYSLGNLISFQLG